ncbi:MAG: hypothetical protein ACYTF0_04670 [Planctomycetota bacterium]|jgi:hypothetical protein
MVTVRLHLIVVFICAICVLPAAEVHQLTRAEQALLNDLSELEDDLLRLRTLDPSSADRELTTIRPRLDRLLDQAEGSRFENRACFWLADWHMTYGDWDEAGRLLNRLTHLPHPSFQQAGRALGVRILLDQGDIEGADALAERLSAQTREYAPLRDLVAFHRSVGQAAPLTSGRALLGSGDPAATTTPWQVFIFARLGDPSQRRYTERLLAELARPDYRPAIDAVVVSFDGDPLAAMAISRELPQEALISVLWANPHERGDGDNWQRSWQLPSLPGSVLLGPDRTIYACNPRPPRLRPLVGLAADDEAASSSGSLWRGRGRYGTR